MLAHDLEALQPLANVGPFDVHGLDVCAPRTGLHPGDYPGDGLPRSLQERLDRAVSSVTDPSRHAARVRLLLQAAAKVDALHPSANDDVGLGRFVPAATI